MSLRNQLTLFVATDWELDAAFPGWRLPLAERAGIPGINPFTREPMTEWTWDPGRPAGLGPIPSLEKVRRRKPVGSISPPENDEDRWLQEKQTAALLRTFPHSTMNGVSYRPLTELLAVLGLPDSPPARILDCREDEGWIVSLPGAVVGPLARLGNREAKKALAAWQAALGLKGKSRKLIEEEAAVGSDWALRRIRALASAADERQALLFLHQILE